MTFRVGQEVVCVDDDLMPGQYWTITFPIKKGNIYTISIIGDSPMGRLCLGLKECGDTKVNWYAARFRPIVKTDISIFTAMLAPSPKQAEKVE